ncbi:DNA binding protein [Arthrobacter phage Snek]
MTFSRVLSDIFDRNVARRFESAEAEKTAIAAAKLGDEDAIVAIMYAYSNVLRSGAANAPGLDTEDARQTALLGLLEAVQKFDLDDDTYGRLAGLAKACIFEAISAAAPSAVAFAVPQRTLTRFFSILRKADGNVYEAAALAPEHHMSREVFFSVLSAVRNVDSYDALTGSEEDKGGSGEGSGEVVTFPLWDASEVEDDALLVAAAFDAVDEVEERVCRMAYGFESYGDPVPDVEIAHELGMTRPTVQRRRSSALGKMREALAVS